jgi:hypothetical protein
LPIFHRKTTSTTRSIILTMLIKALSHGQRKIPG